MKRVPVIYEKGKRMKSNTANLLRILLVFPLLLLGQGVVCSQQPSSSPKPATTATSQGDGDSLGDYDVISSIELVIGSQRRWRSQCDAVIQHSVGPLFDTSFRRQGRYESRAL
jgi:hypothetical protein